MSRGHVFIMGIAALGLLCAGSVLGQAPLGTTFTYQGQLLESGEPVTGSVDFRFSLWDAVTGGSQLGSSYITPSPVGVVDGLFTVSIDSANFGPNGFNGEARWLRIDVDDGGWVTLSPRQPITPAPYALYAADSPGGGDCLWSENGSDIYYNTGDVGVGTSTPDYPLHAISTGGGTAVGGENPGESTSGYLGHEYGGVYGEGSYAGYFVGRGYFSGDVGVGVTNPSEKLDVNGTVKMTGFELSTAPASGYVLTSDAGGVGTWQPGGGGSLWQANGTKIYYNTDNVGIGTADPNVPLHVTTSADPVAVLARNTATSGTGSGVWAETATTEGSGVFGQNTASSGQNEGVMGVSWSSFGKGVMGYNGSTASTAIGVLGRTSGGAGVQGEATSTSAYNKGVHGLTSSPNGYGVYGYAPTDGKGVAGYSGDDDYGYLGWNGGGVYGYSVDGYGVRGYSVNDWGVFGSVPFGSTQAGVIGAIRLSNNAIQWVPESGVCGSSEDGYGVSGRVDGGMAVYGTHDDSGNFGYLATDDEGAYGETSNSNSYGVHGKATGNYTTTNGVYGEATGAGFGIGVRGSVSNTSGVGVYGYNGASGYGGSFYSSTGTAGRFVNNNGDCVVIDYNAGVYSNAALNIDVSGSEEPVAIEAVVDATYGRLAAFELNNATSYIGTSFIVRSDCGGDVASFINDNTTTSDSSDYAVYAEHLGEGSGVYAKGGGRGMSALCYPTGSSTYYGLYAYVSGGSGTNRAVYGRALGGTNNYAGYFNGDVTVTGMMSKGGGSFKIDHPLDPENKYLYHSFVESPDMMNIYNGNVVLNSNGEAVVTMPEWFEALNMEFRYQLTCIGGFAQVYIAQEIIDNQFKIAGGKPGLKVSWQVTGVRQDPFANANRVQVEVDKPEDERATYLHPEAWGMPAELQLDRVLEAQEAEIDAESAD